MAAPLLLFVCTANACRSPMAAALADQAAKDAGVALRVASAGTATAPGYPAAAGAREAMGEINLSLEDHRSRPVTRELISEAALVVTATQRQKQALSQFFGPAQARIVSFGELTGRGDLADPIGGNAAAFRATRDLLRSEMPKVLAAVAAVADASLAGADQGPSK
ncbi:MAG: hypothetical protein M3T49_07530 [Candidatus Eremiobacteraeota bacterium]|nr:hypothetical protein [Candidatus Eremiobacteraeota bacterium]